MPEPQSITYLKYTFTKDMSVDYKKGNPVVNSIFKQFDKNLNGKFEDAEWTSFGDYIEKNNKKQNEIKNSAINNEVVSYYDKKMQRITNQLEKLEQNYEKLDLDAFDELLKFEQEHLCICRAACKDKKDVPKDSKEFDATSFEMGVYDEEKQAFTGEVCQYGYITGFDKLTKDEQKQYLNLLSRTQKALIKCKQNENERKDLFKKYDKYYSLRDLAVSGEINTVGSEEYENQMYERYTNIREVSNPFYKQIKEIETKRNELWLKAKTDEDFRQIEQYNIQLKQLEDASRQWSIKYSNESFDSKYGNKLKISADKQDQTLDAGKSTNQNSINLSFLNENVDINGMASLTNTTNFGNNFGIERNLTYNLGMGYSRGNFKIKTATTMTMTNSSNREASENNLLNLSNFGQTFNLTSGNFNLEGQGTLSENLFNGSINTSYTLGKTTFSANGSGAISSEGISYQNYGLGLKQKIGNFSLGADLSTDTHSLTYKVSSAGDFNGTIGKNTTYNISPSLDTQYNDMGKSFTVAPGINAGVNINQDKTNYSLNISNNSSVSFSKESKKPETNNTFSFTGTVNHKNWTGQLNYTNTSFSGNNTNTFGASVGYRNEKLSTELSYNLSVSPNTENNKNKLDNGVNVSVNVNLGTPKKKSLKNL